jgi:hypothetical protein
MSKVWVWWACAAVLTAVAGAVTYVSEDFSGDFPPSGWSWNMTPGGSGGNGLWFRDAGPYGYCAHGAVTTTGGDSFTARLFSPYLTTVPAGSTVYFRFDFRRWHTGSGYNLANFVIGVPPNPWAQQVFYTALNETGDTWTVCTGSAVASLGTMYVAAWYVYVAGYSPPVPGTHVTVDNVMVADEPFAAVMPASMGRVRALFR